MFHKIKIIFFSLIFILLCAFSFLHKGNVETSLLKTLIPEQIFNSNQIISIANKSSSIIKVVFESDDQTDLENLTNDFNKQINHKDFDTESLDISSILNQYTSQPTNFLSNKTRKLLKEKKYDEVYSQSLENLYNPTSIQITTFDKDPYMLLNDFIMSLRKISNSIDYIDGKYYNSMSLKIKDNGSLSPDSNNQKIKQLIKIQEKLSNKHSKIYLAGTPIHTYYTSNRSVTDINIICLLSTILIIFLTYKYFKDIKLLLLIALSIIFGMLCGYSAIKLWFDSVQVITLVFSTTLIGIGIDYSYHYFFAKQIDKNFIQNLSFSLITTIVPFALLYITKIELLEQVAIFTIFGLIGIYLFVLCIYPCFKLAKPIKTYLPNHKLYKISLIVLIIFSLVGLARFHFNDNLTALYSPSKKLLKAENLYNKISGENLNTQIITVQGNSIEDIIKTEEQITPTLDKNNIEYIALSKIFPSKDKQKENFDLVKALYNKNLNNYANILSNSQIQSLKNLKYSPVEFNNLYLKDLMLNNKTSIIIVFDNQKLNINNSKAHIINLQDDIKNYMKHYRHILLTLFPIVIILLYVLLAGLYNFKKALKVLLPSVIGTITAILLTTMIYGELNLFSIITIFLVLGFTIDYSIFRISEEEKTESAIFMSCLTTSFSFLLLALSGFKLLSSMALVLCVGIISSYLSGYLLLTKHGRSNYENS